MHLMQSLFLSISESLMILRILPWYGIYRLLTSPFFLFPFVFILRFFFFGPVGCYSYLNNIIVVDRLIESYPGYSPDYYQCWLVHLDYVSRYLWLPDPEIDYAIITGYPVYSPTMQQVYISQLHLGELTWSQLILRHPELAYAGVTCTRIYSSSILNYAGPRNAEDTLSYFLTTYCPSYA